jgi:hypothetical protein
MRSARRESRRGGPQMRILFFKTRILSPRRAALSLPRLSPPLHVLAKLLPLRCVTAGERSILRRIAFDLFRGSRGS